MYESRIASVGLREQDTAQGQRLLRLVRVFRKWYHLPDPGVLLSVLGAYAANRIAGMPVWLLIVGPPSAGKTEILNSLNKLAHIFPTGTLTEAGLLSGARRRGNAKDVTGGLLQRMGSFGVIVAKDFTSILSISHEARTVLLAALREIYDGSWARHVGVDGGRTLTWEGKVGLIAGCTPTIDSHHAVISAMGDRFVIYRMPPADERALAARALSQTNSEELMHEEIGRAISDLFSDVATTVPKLDEAGSSRIAALAILAARARSSVERHPRTREIELIPQPEAPGRLAKQLQMLVSGLLIVGLSDAKAWKLLMRVALDCLPALRGTVLRLLQNTGRPIKTSEVAENINYPIQTTRRGLEDLAAHRVLIKQVLGDGPNCTWSLSAWATEQLRAILGSVPEKSGDHK